MIKNVSNSLHYAVELLSTIAQKGSTTLRDISSSVSKDSTLSLNFLEQIARKLRIANIISVKHGPGGGYSLVKNVKTLTIGDLLDANILRRNPTQAPVPEFRAAVALEEACKDNG